MYLEHLIAWVKNRLGGTHACWLWTTLSVVTLGQSIILGFDDRIAVVFQVLMRV